MALQTTNFQAVNRSRLRWSTPRAGFSLLELLVVLGIIMILISLVLPGMGRARHEARDVACKANLKGLGTALRMYGNMYDDYVVPAFNMKGISGSRSNPFDGWAAILDRELLAVGQRTLNQNAFACPETANVAGLAATNRGSSDDQPLGYMEWPAVVAFTGVLPTTIPQRGFDKIVRVSYWINGDSPIGAPHPVEQGRYYTAAVGYGPDADGQYLKPNNARQFRAPARLIALADGIFTGNQHATRAGQKGLRIGYRHGSGIGAANVSFADGHVDAVAGDQFPRGLDVGLSLEEVRRENLGTGPTVYAAPEKHLMTVLP